MTELTSFSTPEFRAYKARARFLGTAAALKERLEPAQLVSEAVTGARSGLNGVAHRVAGKAVHRPVAAATVAVGILVFLMRGRLYRMVRRPRG